MKRNIKKDKKGIAGQIMLLIIMGLVLMFIVLLVYIGHLLLPPLISTAQEAGGILQDTMQSTKNPELINASEASFVPATNALNNMEWLSYTLAIVSFLVFLIMCFYVRVYPFLIVFWIIFIAILLFLSIYLSVTYQELIKDPTLGNYYTSWENTSFILQNLPLVILIMGIVGGVIMFIMASREQEVELGGGPL